LADARPIKEEWNIKPYLGVFPLVFSALNKAAKQNKLVERAHGTVMPVF